jgi:hypothetical protein
MVLGAVIVGHYSIARVLRFNSVKAYGSVGVEFNFKVGWPTGG